MGIFGKIFKWIVIWTAILFVPIFGRAVLATILVALWLGPIASVGIMVAIAAAYFLSPPILTIWAIGVAAICLANLLYYERLMKNEKKRISRRMLLLFSSICIIVPSLIIFGVTYHPYTGYSLADEKGSQVTLKIQINDEANLRMSDTGYVFCYYLSVWNNESTPFRVWMSKPGSTVIFSTAVGSIHYSNDGLLKISVLESNPEFVRLLVERIST